MRRFVLVMGIAAVGVTVIAAACTFPDVSFGDGNDSGSGAETGAETSTPVEAGTDAPTDSAKPDLDAMLGDAQMAIDAEACDAADCDCDKDGFLDIKKRSASCDAGADAAAYDCDDLVEARSPGQKEFQTATTPDSGPPPLGDWNCNGKVQLYYDTNLKCAGVLGCGASTSDQHPQMGSVSEGFIGTVGCGEKATLYTCVPEGAGCTAKENKQGVTQGCL